MESRWIVEGIIGGINRNKQELLYLTINVSYWLNKDSHRKQQTVLLLPTGKLKLEFFS